MPTTGTTTRRCSSRWEPAESVAQARPQAQPGLPPAGNGPGKGVIDALYCQSKVLSCSPEATGKLTSIEDLSRYPDWRLQVGQHPGRHHLQRRDGRAAPRTRRRVHERHDQGRALGQRAQARGGGDPRRADVLSGRRGHVPGTSSSSIWCRTCRRRTWPPWRSGRTSC